MNMLIMIIVLTALSGIGGTGIGAALSSTVKKSSNKAMSLLLSFASGTMISIVCLDLFHDALETGMSKGGIALFVIIGFLTVYLLERVMDEKAKRAKSRMSRKMMTAGIAMMFAVACHNIPVGMTIGASAISHGGLIGSPAMTLAVFIGIHNVPEGMAICAPLLAAGMTRGKAVLLTALSGAAIVVGGILGYWIGDMGQMGLAVSLSFASSAMLYVNFGEILPESNALYRGKTPAFFTVLGILLGMMFMHTH